MVASPTCPQQIPHWIPQWFPNPALLGDLQAQICASQSRSDESDAAPAPPAGPLLCRLQPPLHRRSERRLPRPWNRSIPRTSRTHHSSAITRHTEQPTGRRGQLQIGAPAGRPACPRTRHTRGTESTLPDAQLGHKRGWRPATNQLRIHGPTGTIPKGGSCLPLTVPQQHRGSICGCPRPALVTPQAPRGGSGGRMGP